MITKAHDSAPQKEMANSAEGVRDVLGTFELSELPRPDPVLLADDVVDSRWTLTVIGALPREHGVSAVHPLVLARATDS